MHNSARLAIPIPDETDSPPDIPAAFAAQAVILDTLVPTDIGTLAARPVSTAGSPGISGRQYIVNDQPDSPRLDVDYGTGWFTTMNPNFTKPAAAYRNAGLSLPAASWTKVSIDTIEFPATGSNFDVVTNNRYVVPATGFYIVMGLVAASYSSPPSGVMFGGVWKNGVEMVRGSRQNPTTSGIYYSFIGGFVDCSASDYLDLHIYTDAAGTLGDVGSSFVNYLHVARFG